MPLTRIKHARQLHQRVVPQLVRMVAALRRVFSSARDKHAAIVRLDTAEANRYVEILQELLLAARVRVHVVVCYNLLVKFEKVYLIDPAYQILIRGSHLGSLNGSLRSLLNLLHHVLAWSIAHLGT